MPVPLGEALLLVAYAEACAVLVAYVRARRAGINLRALPLREMIQELADFVSLATLVVLGFVLALVAGGLLGGSL